MICGAISSRMRLRPRSARMFRVRFNPFETSGESFRKFQSASWNRNFSRAYRRMKWKNNSDCRTSSRPHRFSISLAGRLVDRAYRPVSSARSLSTVSRWDGWRSGSQGPRGRENGTFRFPWCHELLTWVIFSFFQADVHRFLLLVNRVDPGRGHNCADGLSGRPRRCR